MHKAEGKGPRDTEAALLLVTVLLYEKDGKVTMDYILSKEKKTKEKTRK